MRKWVVMTVVVMACAMFGVAAHGLVIEVNPGDPNWVSEGNSGGGSSAITATNPDDNGGLGSLELTGDRTRFVSYNTVDPTGFGLLSDLDTFGFEWALDAASVSGLHEDYTPAIRLLVWDPDAASGTRQYTELIWEGAYNGYYGAVTEGVWYDTDVMSETMWRWEGFVTLDGGAQVNQSVGDWADSGNGWFSSNAFIYGVSVGVGSSIGSEYHAYADFVDFGFAGAEATTFDFEPTAPVPEPATLGLLGIGVLGLAARKRFWNR